MGAVPSSKEANCGRKAFVRWLHPLTIFSWGNQTEMTKKLLLAAASLGVLALAGAAGAAEITSAKVSGVTLTGPGGGVYTVASQVVTTDVANLRTTTTGGDNVIVGSVSNGGAFGPGIGGRTYGATLKLTGAKFQDAVTSGDIELVGGTPANCLADAVIVEGGAANGTSVTVAITIPAGCAIADAPNGVAFDVPFTLDAAAATASAAVNFVVGAAETPYDGGAATVQLVRKASAYDLTVTADNVPTTLALAGVAPYTALLTGSGVDNVLGSIKVGFADAPVGSAADAIFANLDGGATGMPTLTYDLQVKAESGDFEVISLELGGDVLDVDAADNTIALIEDVAAGTAALTAHIAPGNDVSLSSSQAYSVTVTPSVAPSTVVAKPAVVSGAVQTIGLEGTNFVAPWFTLNNANNTAFLRLSNNGSGSTGPIFLTLKSANGAVTTASVTLTQSMLAEGTLSAGGGIAANSAILITGSALATAFGTTAGNGDVQVTIQASDANLTAKTRVRTASGVVTETSLGRLGDAGVSF